MHYKLVSADGHVNEPPTIWSDRIPAKYRDRAPKMASFDEGDAWIFEGWDGVINFGYNAAAGLPVEAVSPWVRWSDVPARTHVPAERLKALDQGGVDAELLYATPRIAGGMLASASDPEFHLACIRAYNDWLSEFCSHAPDRLMGHALMPAVGAAAAVDELHRTMQLPGIRSPYIGRWPSGQASLSPEDDVFWSAVHELGVPVSVHVSVATGDQRGDFDANRTRLGARGEFRGLGGPTAVNCLELISTGVFDRFPDMRIVFAECESGWVPCARQTFDDRFKRYPPGVRGRPEVKELPGYYFDRNIFTTFVIDPYAIRNRDLVGVTQMMWSNDLFHAVNEWPHDWAAIERDFAGVPAGEKDLILANNAVRIYGLDPVTTAGE
jgi:predicted TIM-barrel fold metal-dependent hydrolase